MNYRSIGIRSRYHRFLRLKYWGSIADKVIDYVTFVAIADLDKDINEYDPGDEYSVLEKTADEAGNGVLWDGFNEEIRELETYDRSFDRDRFALGFIRKVADVWQELESEI